MSNDDKQCRYPKCMNAGAPCRPECVVPLSFYISPYDGFTETRQRAKEVLQHFSEVESPDWEGELRALLAGCGRSAETDEAVERARAFLLKHRTSGPSSRS